MSLYLNEFLALMLVHFLAVISPGPDFAIVISQTVKYGKKTGFTLAAGITFGIFLHICYTLIGVAAVLKANETVFTIIKFLGAGYIIYIAFKLLSAKKPESVLDAKVNENPDNKNSDINIPSFKRTFLLGFFTNATNPKVTLFFLSIFSTVVSSQTPIFIQSFYGFWICLTTFLWFCTVAKFFSSEIIRMNFFRYGYIFERFMGVVLILLVIKLLWDF